MKKALKINIGGHIFHIDEDAYEKLKIYLDTISSHFSNIEESKEIISDIETRIAELLNEMIGDGSQVVTLKEVNEVIKIMGRPEDIVDEEGAEEKAGSDYAGDHRRYRRLYRDPDNSVFGGVAAGLGAYFNFDVVAIRVLFVVFTLIGWGFPIILYIVLWIAIPKANTAAEKLEMRGEKVNVSNLEKKIREEYEDMKKNFSKARNSDAGKRTENFIQEFLRILGVILIALLKIILVIVAIGFVIAGLSLVVSIIAFAFFGAASIPFTIFQSGHFELSEMMVPFFDPVNLSIIAVAAALVILIPIFAIVYGLFKVLFNFKAKDRSLGISATALWILALVTTITMVAAEARNFSEHEDISTTITLDEYTGNTLSVMINEEKLKRFREEKEIIFDGDWYLIENEEEVFGEISIDIEKSRNEFYELRIEKESRGPNEAMAARLAEAIQYNFDITDSILYLDPWFTIDLDDNWRFQDLELTLFIPEGKSVHLNENTGRFLEGIYNLDNYSSYRMAGKTWMMNEDGLEFTRPVN